MRRTVPVVVAVLAMAAATLLLAAPARAAELTPVTGFGSNPGNLAMYAYRPDGMPTGAPAVVLLHGCSQNASGYVANSGWRTFADRWRFALVVRRTTLGQQLQLLLQLLRDRRHRARAGRGAVDPADGRARRLGVRPERRPGSTSAGCPPAGR